MSCAGPGVALGRFVKPLAALYLVLVEGFKQGYFPKLEVWRASEGKQPLWPDWPGIVAIAVDEPTGDLPQAAQGVIPVRLLLTDVSVNADFVLANATTR